MKKQILKQLFASIVSSTRKKLIFARLSRATTPEPTVKTFLFNFTMYPAHSRVENLLKKMPQTKHRGMR